MSVSTTDQIVGVGLAELPRVNLLPPEIGAARAFKKVQLGLATAVVVSAASVALLYVSGGSAVTDAQAEVDAASATATSLQQQKAEYVGVTSVYARAEAAQAMLTTAMGEEVRYSRLLNDLALTIPDNVWVTDANYDQTGSPAVPGASPSGIGTLTVTGKAYEHDDVARWLESLESQAGLSGAQLQSSTEVAVQGRLLVDWSSTVPLTPEALSGRYLAPLGD